VFLLFLFFAVTHSNSLHKKISHSGLDAFYRRIVDFFTVLRGAIRLAGGKDAYQICAQTLVKTRTISELTARRLCQFGDFTDSQKRTIATGTFVTSHSLFEDISVKFRGAYLTQASKMIKSIIDKAIAYCQTTIIDTACEQVVFKDDVLIGVKTAIRSLLTAALLGSDKKKSKQTHPITQQSIDNVDANANANANGNADADADANADADADADAEEDEAAAAIKRFFSFSAPQHWEDVVIQLKSSNGPLFVLTHRNSNCQIQLVFLLRINLTPPSPLPEPVSRSL
jgi:hypothetical protein